MISRSRAPILARVEDLERSPEWMALTCDINNLQRFNSQLSTLEQDKAKASHVTNKSEVNDHLYHWKPRTEFERNYFGDPENHNEDQIINKKAFKLNRNSYWRPRADILFNPGSEEFRGSRDRLHEIFEHNRLLRSRFFGSENANANLSNENDSKGKPEALEPKEGIDARVTDTGIIQTRLESDTHVTSRFGSTETLTSQSNQSVSSNGRKSRADFDTSMELIWCKNREPFDRTPLVSRSPDKFYASYARVENSPPVPPVRKVQEVETCVDFEEELRSPQLVSSFSSMSSRDGSEITAPGTGTALPFLYGPIPYKSPRRYVEGEVTIHYRSPVRTEAKEILSEEELARRSAENMRRVYQEERRRKYLQELHDIDSRRHTDNFIPSQKSPIPLNRYDDFLDDLSYRSRSQEQTPEPRLVARAMYNFVGQTSRELSFRRGDIILIRRQIDKNWYEGEHNAMVGLFPLNYVEVLPFEGMRSTPKKPYEGQARAKFNFIAQTNLELSLVKGELVVLTRRVDDNWFEGRVGNRKGIFPVTYVEVIMEPGQHRPETPVSSKPVASPAAHSMLSNGTASGKLSMGPHHYTPSIPVKTSSTEPQYISLPRIGVTERNKLHVAPVNETLHIDTHSDTLPYRALYNYRPQNEDELELKENDTVFVIEKCDDGWFVGSSQRTGYFGTFPGNYVERL